MRAQLGRSLPVCLVLAIVGTSATAHAWTRTVVKGADATVDIERDATLSILLRLDVEVHAGWLHELELVDLGKGFELDRYRPPYFRSEEGELFRPEVEVVGEDRIRLSFSRREAPRRGVYRAYMRYRTRADASAVEGATHARVVWSVPAWETGLHGVSVEIRAPKGSTVPAELQDTPPGIDFEVTERARRTVITWERVHLPRTTPWPLSVDVPLKAIDLPAKAVLATKIPAGFRPLTIPEERPLAWTLLIVVALMLLKRASVERRMGRDALLIRAPWKSVLLVSAIVLVAGQWLSPLHLLFAAPLTGLALHRPFGSPVAPTSHDWKPATLGALPRPRTRASELLDGTTATGTLVLLATGIGLIELGEPTAALLLLPLFLTGTRHHLPAEPADKSVVLRNFASELRLPAEAPEMGFAWDVAADATPRLRIELRQQRTGLRTLGFIVASAPLGFALRRKVMLMVQTRAQSEADDLVRRRTQAEPLHRKPDGSVIRLVPWDDAAVELLRVLSRKAPKTIKASRGTWLLREMTDPKRRAA